MCGFAKSACWLGFHLDGISNLECKFDLKRKHFYRYNIWNMSSWANIVTKCLCLVFRSIFIPSGWLWGNWYFHSFFCGSAEGWGGNMNLKGVDEKAKIPPIKQRPTLRLWMNGKLIPKPVGYSPIWPEGSRIKEYGRNTKVLNKQMKCRLAGKIAGSKKVIGFPKTTIWRGQRLRWWWCILVPGVWWP